MPTFYKDVDAVASAGMTFISTNLWAWEVTGFYTIQGQLVRNWTTKLPIMYKWDGELEKYKTALAYAKSKGLKVHLSVAPLWHAQLTESDYLYVTQESFSFIASKLGSYVDAWQLWNEPDIYNFRNYQQLSGPLDPLYLEKFKAAFAVAAGEIRKVKPSARISINAGGSYSSPSRPATQARWLQLFDSFRGFISQGLLTDIKLNIYTVGSNQGTVEGINEFSRYGVPVWIGEFGYPSSVDETKKTFILDMARTLLQAKVAGINVYRMRDEASTPAAERFGIENIYPEIFRAMK